MSILDVSLDWKLLLSCLPEDYEELAVTHKQLQTQYGNAKITTAEQLLRLFFVHVGAELPLRQTVASIAAAGGPKLAPMRLHMKMRRAVPYLHALVERMCVEREDASPELWSGYDLCALDGSTVCGPGATGTDARLHANIRLSDLRVLEAQVTDPAVGETFKNFSFEPGQLVLADRGYSNAPGIAWVREHQADVLVRLNRGALPIIDPEDGQTLDVLAWVRSLPDDTAVERAVFIKDATTPRCQRIEGRLVATRLPPKQTQEARARVQREQGSDASSDTIEMAGYVVLFTTTPSVRLSAARCLEAYRLRWQVELLFKRWKSLGGMDQLPNQRDDTTLAWLYVKLLLGLIVERLGSAAASAAVELSPPVRLLQHDRPTGTRPATARAAALEGRQPALARGRCSRASAVAR